MIGWEHTFVHELHHLLTAIRDDARRRAARRHVRGRLPRRRGLRRDAALRRAGRPRDRDVPQLMPTVLLDRHAGHEGRRVRASCASGCATRGVDVLVADAGHGRAAARARARHLRGGARGRGRRGPRRARRPRRGGRRRWPTRPRRSPRRLHDEGRIDGVLAAGGSGNTAIATAAMRALPVGVPEAHGLDAWPRATRATTSAASDITMMASVTDVAGLNSISARILANAAAAMAGMVGAPPVELGRDAAADRRDDVRRHHAVRDARARAARGARLRGARLPRHRHRRQGDGGARRRAASSPACST